MLVAAPTSQELISALNPTASFINSAKSETSLVHDVASSSHDSEATNASNPARSRLV